MSIHMYIYSICIVSDYECQKSFHTVVETYCYFITKESARSSTKAAHCMATTTSTANNGSALSKEYLKGRQAELKEPA